MTFEPSYEILSKRITSHMAIAKNEQEAREINIVWRAYIVALHEWEVISTQTMDRLARLLPMVEDDLITTLAVGVYDEDDEE